MMCGRKPKISSSIASTLFMALTPDGLRAQSTLLDTTIVRQMQFRRFRPAARSARDVDLLRCRELELLLIGSVEGHRTFGKSTRQAKYAAEYAGKVRWQSTLAKYGGACHAWKERHGRRA